VRRPLMGTSRRDRARARARGERGAALVEFALILPLLLMIVFATFTGGLAYNHKLDVIHAVREGARYGATIPSTQCTPTSNCNNKTWAELVQSVVVDRSDGALTTSQICVSLVSGSTGAVSGGSSFTTKSDGSHCFSDTTGDTGSRVQVSASKSGDSIQAILFTIPVTLSSQATARFEQ
jgi:Flp pilus assembly protein TadG